MPKGRFEGLFPEEIENRKDYVLKLVESELWTESWALRTVLHHLKDEQIAEILTFEGIPLDIEFFNQSINEKHLVATHPMVDEDYRGRLKGQSVRFKEKLVKKD